MQPRARARRCRLMAADTLTLRRCRNRTPTSATGVRCMTTGPMRSASGPKSARRPALRSGEAPDADGLPRSYKHPYPEEVVRDKEEAKIKAEKAARRERRSAAQSGTGVRAHSCCSSAHAPAHLARR
jgi:hypothetical protein